MTQEERDKMLENLSKSVEDIKMTQEGMQQEIKRLQKIEKSVEDIKIGMKEMDNRLTAKIEEQGKAMKEMDNRLSAELERQRKNMAAMEYNLSEKIDALFDAREMSLEKAGKHDQKIKSIENILERHGLRISILESKLS